MEAISSEIVLLLKVKLSLQNDQRWLLLLSWFSIFFGGGSRDPPSRLENMWFIFQYNTAQRKPFVKSEAFNNTSIFLFDLWLIGYKSIA